MYFEIPGTTISYKPIKFNIIHKIQKMAEKMKQKQNKRTIKKQKINLADLNSTISVLTLSSNYLFSFLFSSFLQTR